MFWYQPGAKLRHFLVPGRVLLVLHSSVVTFFTKYCVKLLGYDRLVSFAFINFLRWVGHCLVKNSVIETSLMKDFPEIIRE